ncbi:hypothetical protein IQ256_18590, partial [cf. Phormidesmis sp. LEGE 11477]|nr:hypothetical protein [cf. Phormidesmis sp. LEGE 11477]
MNSNLTSGLQAPKPQGLNSRGRHEAGKSKIDDCKEKSTARSLSIAALWLGTLTSAITLAIAPKVIAQADNLSEVLLELPVVDITVNSDLDGPITPDQTLTLREAIEVANGTLPLNALSPTESALVTPSATPQIRFALPGDTRIELVDLLPAITAAGLTIDGTTQPGYGAVSDKPAALPIPVPVVSITPSPGIE